MPRKTKQNSKHSKKEQIAQEKNAEKKSERDMAPKEKG